MTRTYNKLVRDKIPQIIQSQGKQPITRILSEEEFKVRLEEKLVEEVAEFLESKSLEELVDIIEVVLALAHARGYSKHELLCRKAQKEQLRGVFRQRIFLEEVIETKGGTDGEQRDSN